MLIKKRNDGETTRAAFEAEALPHVDRLFRLAMWLERNRAEAEDLVQEILMRALQSFHRYTPGTNCRAWLATILHHVRSNRRRAMEFPGFSGQTLASGFSRRSDAEVQAPGPWKSPIDLRVH